MLIVIFVAAGVFMLAKSKTIQTQAQSSPAAPTPSIVAVVGAPVAMPVVAVAPAPALQNQMPFKPVPFIPNKMVTNVANGTSKLQQVTERGTFFRGRMLA